MSHINMNQMEVCMKGSKLKNSKIKLLIITISIVVVLCIIFFTGMFTFKIINRKKLLKEDNMVITGKNAEGSDISESISYEDKKYKYNSNLVNILVLGIDSDKNVSQSNLAGEMGQSDAMYLVSVDTKKKTTSILGIPRDSMAEVEVYNYQNKLVEIARAQITLQYAFGNNCKRSSELSAKAVSNTLCRIPINRVCVFNYDAVSIINDAVGGVEVTFENEFTDESGEIIDPEFVKGNTITLTGEQAGYFLRERDCTISESAMDRLSRQEQYISHLADKMKIVLKKKPWKAVDIVNDLRDKDCIYTDMSSSEILYLATIIKKSGLSMDEVVTLPGKVEMGEEYEEYNLDYSELRKMVIQYFYNEVK